MVVSTRRMMGLISSSLVSFSMEMFSSCFHLGEHVEGEAFAGFVEHALRLLVFLSRSVICERVATRAMMR